MHTHASFDAAKDERTNINAEAVVTCDRASKYTRASSRTYLESSPTRSSRATRRLPEGSTVTPVHPTSILEERMVKKAIPSKQTNQEARLTTNNNYSPYMKRRVRAATYTCKHTRSNAYKRQYEGSIMIQRKPCSEDCQCNQAGKHRMQDANLRHLAIVRRSKSKWLARAP